MKVCIMSEIKHQVENIQTIYAAIFLVRDRDRKPCMNHKNRGFQFIKRVKSEFINK